MLAKQLSTQEARRFDYNSVNDKVRTIVQQNTIEIKSLMRRTAQDNIDIGRKLSEVKHQLGHGKFKAWLEAEFNWREWSARKFMQIARKFKSVNFTDLSVSTSALYLLSSSSTPEHACKEVLERATQGEDISYTKAKNIIADHKGAVNSAVSNAPEPVVEVQEVPAEIQIRDSSYSSAPYSALHTPEFKSVIKQSEDKLSEGQEALVAFQVCNPFRETGHDNEKSDYLLDQEKVDIESPFFVGDLMYLTDPRQQKSKLLGQISEVQEVTATEVIIKILLQSSEVGQIQGSAQ
jgi:Protein of unknown function (DUF3102)